MKIHLKDIISFFTILLVLLGTFQFVLKTGVKYSGDAQTGKVNRIFNHELTSHMVVFGPSVAEVGINANVLANKLNISVYNAAIDGTAFGQYKCMINELADYSEETKYVLFAITYFDFSKMTKLNEPSRFFAHLDNDYVYNDFKEIDPDKIMKMRYIPFYSIIQYSHTFYKNSIIGWKSLLKGKKSDTLNGFVPHYISFTNTLVSSDTAKEFISIDTAQMYSFLKLSDKLKSCNKKVIVVFMPMYEQGQNHFSNMKEIINEMKSWVEPNHFIDFSNSIYCNDESNFYNNNHLNAKGAMLVSEDLARQLLERKLIL